ncbi:uncharacterized protein [Montipora foliosa]|uniref:uncharacterized protein n=1 Tax=Montipora foliosa TaxID=591990 RepID=UPI0035F17D5F
MSDFVRNELEYKEIREFFWTDSQAVLGYVNNDAKRFQVYVANRVSQIRDLTDPSSWYYVESHSNPADEVSRGLTAKQLLEGSRWLSGPEFLWESGACNPERGKVSLLLEADPEVKKASVLTTEVKTVGSFSCHFGVSSWYKATKVIALCLQPKSKLLATKVKEPGKPVARSNNKEDKPVPKLTLSELQQSEKTIIKCLQYENFREELEVLHHINATSAETSRNQSKKKRQVRRKASSLYNLEPFLDQDCLIRVGGRTRRANVSVDRKHPVIIP